MKSLAVAFVIVSIVAVGAMAFAHGTGGWGGNNGGHMGPGYGGQMMGQGHGGQMMGQGHGGPMMGWSGQTNGQDQKYLDETKDVRKEMHDKRFEYFEASRDPKTTRETLASIENDMYELREKMHKNAPRGTSGAYGPGHCW